MTLAFRNLIHVGTLDTAEDIIGQVVVECYDFDEVSGRFIYVMKSYFN